MKREENGNPEYLIEILRRIWLISANKILNHLNLFVNNQVKLKLKSSF